ncbi:MAG: hypothetical protein JWM16_3329 [Verrucomicrobiales bacterium]|nr:hypothetical protein [Verrucomicrobiales bacterium]
MLALTTVDENWLAAKKQVCGLARGKFIFSFFPPWKFEKEKARGDPETFSFPFFFAILFYRRRRLFSSPLWRGLC